MRRAAVAAILAGLVFPGCVTIEEQMVDPFTAAPDPSVAVEAQVGSIAGLIFTLQGEQRVPVDRARVDLRPETRTVVTNESGRFSFDSLVPGEYALDVAAPGYDQRTFEASLGEGAGVFLEIAILRSYSCFRPHVHSVWATDDRALLADAWVSLRPPSTTTGTSGEADAQGGLVEANHAGGLRPIPVPEHRLVWPGTVRLYANISWNETGTEAPRMGFAYQTDPNASLERLAAHPTGTLWAVAVDKNHTENFHNRTTGWRFFTFQENEVGSEGYRPAWQPEKVRARLEIERDPPPPPVYNSRCNRAVP